MIKPIPLWAALCAPLLLAMGCAGGDVTPTPTQSITATPSAAPSPTASATATAAPVTPTPEATATAQPPTPTPLAPTPSMEPTAAPTPDLSGPFPYETLSAYRFFEMPMASLTPLPGVLPYEVASPLWTDGALKDRFVVLPRGETAGFDAEGSWAWPLGTILIKNFAFPLSWVEPEGARHILETRLLINEGEGDWSAHTYVWNDDQTEAVRVEAGKRLVVPLVSAEGESYNQTYLVPNTNQCGNCHEISDVFNLLGPITAQLNRVVNRGEGEVNQLEWLAEQGVFTEAPPSPETLRALVDPLSESDGDLDRRARAYLHANCAHCHQDGGNAHKSGLFLGAFEENPQTWGICKTPVAAGGGSGGLFYDIVPGSPDESILIYRMSSLDPDEKMPEVGNLTIDEAGLALIRNWISSMEPVDCDTYGSDP